MAGRQSASFPLLSHLHLYASLDLRFRISGGRDSSRVAEPTTRNELCEIGWEPQVERLRLSSYQLKDDSTRLRLQTNLNDRVDQQHKSRLLRDGFSDGAR
jgi:hypothetical protein